TRATRCSTSIGASSVSQIHRCAVVSSTLSLSPRWRAMRLRRLTAEEAADAESRAFEEREAENLRRESEAFLARQMDEMQALADEQRKAGLLLEDGAPVKLNVSLAPAPGKDGREKEVDRKVALVMG